MIRNLKKQYKEKGKNIRKRLGEFRKVWKEPDDKIFSELCFCICTPQSRAVYCDKAITSLEKNGKLYNGTRDEIREHLKAVRFPNNKAGFIVEARELFNDDGTIRIKDKINTRDIPATREWIVKNVKGIGFKEAGHFLRNIGFGRELAILDVHILKNMVKYGIIEEVPKSLTKNRYMDLEEKLKGFSKKVDIPMDELDMLFWSAQTGEIFK